MESPQQNNKQDLSLDRKACLSYENFDDDDDDDDDDNEFDASYLQQCFSHIKTKGANEGLCSMKHHTALSWTLERSEPGFCDLKSGTQPCGCLYEKLKVC